MANNNFNLNLLSSQSRIQVPWVKVTIGDYTFGIFTKVGLGEKDSNNFYQQYDVQYPQFINSLSVIKINGQVNQYTLNISYPVTLADDPNFFEKVFSSVSSTRKIIFSYGDASMPAYSYREEEAIITNVQQSFNFGQGGTLSSVINYTVSAVSASALAKSGSYTFSNSPTEPKTPSSVIKEVFKNKNYGLQDLFYGMSVDRLEDFIEGGDKAVILETKVGISALDYINYLVSCMIPSSSTTSNISPDIWVLTIHDDGTYSNFYNDNQSIVINKKEVKGPYFKVTRTSYLTNKSDAYEIDIGIDTSTIVTDFSIQNQENYSLLFDYQEKLATNPYRQSIDDNGRLIQVYAPGVSSQNSQRITKPIDINWWTKVTKYPISATVTVQGLLRPAQLMTYVRLNVIFPGGKKHISSGLYIVTKQIDTIRMDSGYKTQLELTRIGGDNEGPYTFSTSNTSSTSNTGISGGLNRRQLTK